jgi:putative endonuclease
MFTLSPIRPRPLFNTGVTNDLLKRLAEHRSNRGNPSSFAGKYYCYKLLYYEAFQFVKDALVREKKSNGWVELKRKI